MGNSRARAVYEANIPDNFRRPQNDSSLESFVRAKYEHKKYIAREWVPPVIPKVDWEKEIDEEIERQKRKKKAQAAANSSTIDKKPIKIAEVPQIPKPKNASPKPNRTSTASTEKTTQDLLGLQNGEDGFTGFLSGPTPQPPNSKPVKEKKEEVPLVSAEAAAKAEEESFFNQPVPTEKEKTKLTKDSILALYGSAPPTQPQVMFNVPQCTTFPQQGFPAQPFGATFPTPATAQVAGFPPQPAAQPGFPQQPAAQSAFPQMQNGFQTAPFQQFPTQAGQFVAPQMGPNQFMPAQPFAPIQGQFPGMVAQFPTTGVAAVAGQMPQQFPYQQQQPANVFPSGPTAVPNVSAASNPFFGAPQAGGLQQQFAGMSLGGGPMAAAKPPGAAVATNLWQ